MATARQVLNDLKAWSRLLDGTHEEKQATAFRRGAQTLETALDRIAELEDQLKELSR